MSWAQRVVLIGLSSTLMMGPAHSVAVAESFILSDGLVEIEGQVQTLEGELVDPFAYLFENQAKPALHRRFSLRSTSMLDG